MTLTTLLTYIAIAAIASTGIIYWTLQQKKSILMAYLQNFCGILFLFSGWVKAVDPLGTAFKMEDYFAEFYVTFKGTAFDFIAPLFPFLSSYSTAFSILMIIFEIVLGIMLILGDRPKLTSWLFFLLVLFFTGLTGFTFLTGYVPSGVNFFDFGQWGAYSATNMRVTDCGCFGDFIKLEPRISFYKDVFLLIPAIYFLWKHNDMYTLLSQNRRNIIIGVSKITLLLYCIYNFYWNEPHVDFRPFRNGANIAEIKNNEMAAASAVKILFMKMKNKKTGEIKSFTYEEYLKNLGTITEEYETIEQIKSEPTIPETKISHFDITTFAGEEKTEIYLEGKTPHIMIPIYKAKYTAIPVTANRMDSIFIMDTIPVIVNGKDSISFKKTFDKVVESTEETYKIEWDSDFINTITEVINPFIDAAAKDGVTASFVISGIDQDKANDLAAKANIKAEIYTADEKLLKTIMRSNPGIILWNNGVLVHKWHYKKLPEWAEAKKNITAAK